MASNNTTQKIRKTSTAIFNQIINGGKTSVRKLAGMINGSKSSAHRHLQAQEKRNQHPESSFWETDAGGAWLKILVFATLYVFCIHSGVGTDKISFFFKLLRVQTHVATSPSALQTMVRKMEVLLIQFQEACENSVPLEKRNIVAAMDETFFGSFMILVLMDLTSGYLLLEDISEDRSFDTWFAKVTPRLKSLGIDVNYAVSDRAKALIKLAIAGFECDSVADTFHAQHDCSRLLGGQLGKRVETAQTAVNAAQQAEQNVSAKTSKEKAAKLQANTIEAEQTLAEAQKIQQDYHANLQGVSDAIHPFSLMDNTPNDATKIENELEQKAQVFEKIAKDAGISDKKNKINTFRNQIKPLTLGVHNWWLWVWETLKNLMVDEATQHWLTTILLPVVYWHYQMNKADKPHKRVKYQAAWERALDTFKNHPLTAKLPPSEIQRWQMWAESMVRQFHRSSSAVEGRNGCLSQMYHNGRGITEQRLQANTVVHNYGLKREDGTTAAMRLFGTEFPDLFTWLVNEMGELPLPRERKKRAKPNVLNLIIVPA